MKARFISILFLLFWSVAPGVGMADFPADGSYRHLIYNDSVLRTVTIDWKCFDASVSYQTHLDYFFESSPPYVLGAYDYTGLLQVYDTNAAPDDFAWPENLNGYAPTPQMINRQRFTLDLSGSCSDYANGIKSLYWWAHQLYSGEYEANATDGHPNGIGYAIGKAAKFVLQ